jgi:hypothetical protein
MWSGCGNRRRCCHHRRDLATLSLDCEFRAKGTSCRWRKGASKSASLSMVTVRAEKGWRRAVLDRVPHGSRDGSEADAKWRGLRPARVHGWRSLRPRTRNTWERNGNRPDSANAEPARASGGRTRGLPAKCASYDWLWRGWLRNARRFRVCLSKDTHDLGF